MKKLLTIFTTLILLLIVQTSFGTTHNVTINDNAIVPDTFTAAIGDTILWTAQVGDQWNSNSVSLSIPNGATSWHSPTLTPGQSFSYVITTAGNYTYETNAWDTWYAGFLVTAPPPPHNTYNVLITDNAFEPDSLTANVGDTIKWTAASNNQWNVNSASTLVPPGAPAWSSGIMGMGDPDSFSYVVTTPGYYTYQSTAFYPLNAKLIVSGTAALAGHIVMISDNAFTPDSFTAAYGDTVMWIASSGNTYQNNTISTTIPDNAGSWNSGLLSPGQNFWYVITDSGSYSYHSNSWNTFSGEFNIPIAATTTGISELANPANQLIFQNPFNDQLRIYSNQTGLITIFNVLGERIADARIENTVQPAEINTGGLPGGVYFISLSDNGKTLETYKAVKQN